MIKNIHNLTQFDAKLWLRIDDLDTISGATGPFASQISRNNRKTLRFTFKKKRSFQCSCPLHNTNCYFKCEQFSNCDIQIPPIQRNGEKTQTPITKLVSSWKQSVIVWCASASFFFSVTITHYSSFIAGILEKTVWNRSAVKYLWYMRMVNFYQWIFDVIPLLFLFCFL